MLKILDLPGSECLAIEDSLAGIESARAAGVPVIGLHSVFNQPEQIKKADFAVHSFAEAARIIENF